MSSQYPILDNKPIDQWKVTELKEELKRRKLTTRGLKDDLIKRLNGALRIEMDIAAAEMDKAAAEMNKSAMEMDNDSDLSLQPVVKVKNAVPVLAVTEAEKSVVADAIDNNMKVNNVRGEININDCVEDDGQGNLQEVIIMGDSSGLKSDLPVHSTTVETSITVTEALIPDVVLTGEDSLKSGSGELKVNSNVQPGNEGLNPEPSNLDPEFKLGNLGSEPQLGSVGSGSELDRLTSVAQLDNLNLKPQLENEIAEFQLEGEKAEPQLENDGLKPTDEDIMLDHTASNNQVPEVSPNLGFQVKSDSISTDSVSISEKIELKDYMIADNVKLEQDGVKPEIVEQSSNNVLPVGNESHLMDVEAPPKKAYVEEKDDNDATNTDISQKNDGLDVGYSERLDLDRSSGDDSMEEDILESKQIDSKYNADELGDGSEKVEIPAVEEETVVDIVGNDSSNTEKGAENDISTTVPAEKRKLSDQDAVGNMEPLKRRRWNSEKVKVLERHSSSLTPATTPKDAFQPNPLRRNFSRSDSSVNDEPPKERVVPPSQKPPTNALRIDRFLRPFTLKAVQELLGKTGTVTSFWMDQIKTHCYASYSSMEEAIETRNAVYNLQWPPNGGRLLVAEFVDPQEVKMKLEAPPQSPTTPVTPAAHVPVPATAQPILQPQPSSRRQVSREQLPPPPPFTLPPPPPLANAPVLRERLGHPPPPPVVERHDPPIVTLDDLFRKTKATPRIYYLPLSEEQVAAKVAERNKNTKQ